jgi:hypothetical protein
MGKRKPGKLRPFRPSALERYAKDGLRPRMDAGERAWRYTVFVSVAQLQPVRRLKASPRDVHRLEYMLCRHFGGVSTLARFSGYGLRNPRGRPGLPELNDNIPLVVYAAPVPGSDDYFRALRRELEDALKEGVILVERQEVIFG